MSIWGMMHELINQLILSILTLQMGKKDTEEVN